jgi:hypothetical protein
MVPGVGIGLRDRKVPVFIPNYGYYVRVFLYHFIESMGSMTHLS